MPVSQAGIKFCGLQYVNTGLRMRAMGDIAAWLEQIGLAKYGETFRANAIDFDALART